MILSTFYVVDKETLRNRYSAKNLHIGLRRLQRLRQQRLRGRRVRMLRVVGWLSVPVDFEMHRALVRGALDPNPTASAQACAYRRAPQSCNRIGEHSS